MLTWSTEILTMVIGIYTHTRRHFSMTIKGQLSFPLVINTCEDLPPGSHWLTWHRCRINRELTLVCAVLGIMFWMSLTDFSSYLIVSTFQPAPQEWLHLQAKPRNILVIWPRLCAIMLVHLNGACVQLLPIDLQIHPQNRFINWANYQCRELTEAPNTTLSIHIQWTC